MKIKLGIASLFTLGLLSSFVIVILLSVAYFMDFFSWAWLIGITIAINIIMWLIGPYIQDIMFSWLYKIQFYNYEELKDKRYMHFIKKICDQHNIKVPRIGIINDDNPTAFTYGSAAFNARVVVTEGLFKYLDEKELEAVLAHELGHIVNNDFIIMTIATTLLQILYEIYVIFTRSRAKSSSFRHLGKQGKKGGDARAILYMIGWVSYFFYWIGTYIVLFLSRVREYYADEFSAKNTGDPNLLSMALIKIAYGIAAVPDTEKTAHLLNNTRAQGVFDFKAAKSIGLIYANTHVDKSLLEKTMLFDIVNPWAWILELSSTHPLIGKRIERLSSMTKSPLFNFEKIKKTEVNYGKIWGNFLRDILISSSRLIITLIFSGILIYDFIISGDYNLLSLLTKHSLHLLVFAFVMLVLSIINIQYRYPSGKFHESSVLECMSNLYASPVRGKPISLNGRAIGKGQAGYIFGEDMIFQDRTGLIYLNYESIIPIFGNMIFAWKKLETLLNRSATAEGWFLRGATHHIELKKLKTESQVINSHVKFWNIMGQIGELFALAFILFCILMYATMIFATLNKSYILPVTYTTISYENIMIDVPSQFTNNFRSDWASLYLNAKGGTYYNDKVYSLSLVLFRDREPWEGASKEILLNRYNRIKIENRSTTQKTEIFIEDSLFSGRSIYFIKLPLTCSDGQYTLLLGFRRNSDSVKPAKAEEIYNRIISSARCS